MTAATQFAHTDVSAPDITQGPGGLVAVLDFILLGLGWAIVFTNTNQRVYRTNLTASVGFDLSVDDTNANYALVRGFKTASGIGAGADPFPILTQTSVFYRQFTVTPGAVGEGQWYAFATGRWVWLVNKYRNSDSQVDVLGFGEFDAYSAADGFAGALFSRTSTSSANQFTQVARITENAVTGAYLCRDFAGVGPSSNANRMVDGLNHSVYMGSEKYTSNPSGAADIMLRRVAIGDSSTELRGLLPGLLAPLADEPYTEFDRFDGDPAGPLAGAQARAFDVYSNAQIVITDHTDFWV